VSAGAASPAPHPVNVALIGYGYWGPKLGRNLAALPGCRLAAVCDIDVRRLAAAADAHGGIPLTTRYEDLLSNESIEAVAISTPVSTHFDLAQQALRAGKHVFVEKPIARSADEAQRLVDEAAVRGLVLMVGHVFRYAGAVRKVRELVASEHFGKLRYYDSARLNALRFDQDVNALWDLAIHDLSILDYLVTEPPREVSATGISHRADGLESTAYLTVFFDSGLIAHVNVNWLAPEKIRRTLIGGSGQTIVYDDLEPVDKVRVFEVGVGFNGGAPPSEAERPDGAWAPELDSTEALRREMEDFVDSIAAGKLPAADGLAGFRVVRILEAASQSLRARGRPVELAGDGC
jgi:predicted dehydrogenase